MILAFGIEFKHSWRHSNLSSHPIKCGLLVAAFSRLWQNLVQTRETLGPHIQLGKVPVRLFLLGPTTSVPNFSIMLQYIVYYVCHCNSDETWCCSDYKGANYEIIQRLQVPYFLENSFLDLIKYILQLFPISPCFMYYHTTLNLDFCNKFRCKNRLAKSYTGIH